MHDKSMDEYRWITGNGDNEAERLKQIYNQINASASPRPSNNEDHFHIPRDPVRVEKGDFLTNGQSLIEVCDFDTRKNIVVVRDIRTNDVEMVEPDSLKGYTPADPADIAKWKKSRK